MEQQLLQFIGIFIGGLVSGIVIMLVFNKLSSGTASPKGLKQEYDDYQAKVETHFEETSKKFQDMTTQYQDLYKHLSVGATSLCRPDSVAATLVDQSVDTVKIEAQSVPDAAKAKVDQAIAAKEKVDKALAAKAKVSEENVNSDNIKPETTGVEKTVAQAEPSKSAE